MKMTRKNFNFNENELNNLQTVKKHAIKTKGARNETHAIHLALSEYIQKYKLETVEYEETDHKNKAKPKKFDPLKPDEGSAMHWVKWKREQYLPWKAANPEEFEEFKKNYPEEYAKIEPDANKPTL